MQLALCLLSADCAMFEQNATLRHLSGADASSLFFPHRRQQHALHCTYCTSVWLAFTPTCEEAAVVLLHFLCRLKLLLGMFLREFVAQVLRVPLLSVDTVHQQDLDSRYQSHHLS